jgi:hypothetical protein
MFVVEVAVELPFHPRSGMIEAAAYIRRIIVAYSSAGLRYAFWGACQLYIAGPLDPLYVNHPVVFRLQGVTVRRKRLAVCFHTFAANQGELLHNFSVF